MANDTIGLSYKSFNYSTTLITLAAAGSAGSVVQEKILLDAFYMHECKDISVDCSDKNVLVQIDYNSEDKLTNTPTLIGNIANVNGAGKQEIEPFIVNPNAGIILTLQNLDDSENKIQITFKGKRYYKKA
ncbi:MAG TPA: hypothetical protein PKY81_15030 [bacterium]|nr:hypothetical protein [bacterium]